MVELQVLSPIYFSAFSKICLISMDYFNNQKRYYKKKNLNILKPKIILWEFLHIELGLKQTYVFNICD